MKSKYTQRMKNIAATKFSKDYQKIEQALGLIKETFEQHPSLNEIAKSVGISQFHFERLFKQWVGITPFQYMQFLTMNDAKEKLAHSKSVLKTTLEVGLSSPGRLHDLFVTFDAITPGEYKTKGFGIEIRYGFHPSPFGICLIGVTKRGICYLEFLEDFYKKIILEELHGSWNQAYIIEDTAYTQPFMDKLFPSTCSTHHPIHLFLKGTNFQIKVWEALLSIPYGGLVSYETVATTIGLKSATRAVANAISKNPIAYLIPCHRVIYKTGQIGKYKWGAFRKQALIEWEQNQVLLST